MIIAMCVFVVMGVLSDAWQIYFVLSSVVFTGKKKQTMMMHVKIDSFVEFLSAVVCLECVPWKDWFRWECSA